MINGGVPGGGGGGFNGGIGGDIGDGGEDGGGMLYAKLPAPWDATYGTGAIVRATARLPRFEKRSPYSWENFTVKSMAVNTLGLSYGAVQITND